jgi:hypothetical protein
MSRSKNTTTTSGRPAKPSLKWMGVVFAFAANLFLTSAADAMVARLPFGFDGEILATMVAPLLAGVATALYTRSRGGMHALIGGMLSVPILAFYIFPGNWQFALLSGLFCTLGGALTEILLRGRSS